MSATVATGTYTIHHIRLLVSLRALRSALGKNYAGLFQSVGTFFCYWMRSQLAATFVFCT